MLNELNSLEGKVDEVVALCQALRAENGLLREQLALAEADKKSLGERMGAACARLQQLAEQFPQTTD